MYEWYIFNSPQHPFMFAGRCMWFTRTSGSLSWCNVAIIQMSLNLPLFCDHSFKVILSHWDDSNEYKQNKM